MCFATVERMAGGQHGLAQYGLPEGKATETDRVETAEGMKRIAFVSAAAHSLIQEAQIEAGVVADQNRPLATGLAHGLAHGMEDIIQRQSLRQCAAQRVVWIDAGNFQRARIEIRAGERFDVR